MTLKHDGQWHWGRAILCRVGKSSVQPDVNMALSRMIAGPCEWRANVAKVNEITMVDGGAKAIHLASWIVLTIRGFPSPRQFQLSTLIGPDSAAKQPLSIRNYLPQFFPKYVYPP
ncbi:hypothetical protein SO802_006243 [Lithocarpus litseifolius]|uniref:Uncharacterized protein n=1 Tax=Lithocarpus litseifolius TaxID=425828 RepID=A0AAW2DPA7_9ROSI